MSFGLAAGMKVRGQRLVSDWIRAESGPREG